MEEAARPHVPTGPVVLDIGDGVGALVVHTDASLAGREVEVSPAGAPTRRVHADVLARTQSGSVTYAVVIPGLREGPYTLWRDPTHAWGEVVVTGGTVTEVDWRTTAPS